MSLYHASLLAWSGGEWIAPGGWGRRMRAMGVGHNLYFRERELEAARLRVAPSAPSRWTCAFTFTDLGYAQQHAQQEAQRQRTPLHVYEVMLGAGTNTARVSMGHINTWWSLRELAAIEPWADRYWEQSPYAGQDAEVLVDGRLQVMQFVAEFLPGP